MLKRFALGWNRKGASPTGIGRVLVGGALAAELALQDRVHLRDLIDVGLLDRSWLPTLPPELSQRLQSLLDTPGG